MNDHHPAPGNRRREQNPATPPKNGPRIQTMAWIHYVEQHMLPRYGVATDPQQPLAMTLDDQARSAVKRAEVMDAELKEIQHNAAKKVWGPKELFRSARRVALMSAAVRSAA